MDFLEEIADILEEDSITGETVLKDCENWDSLSILSVVALVDKIFKVNLTVTDIRSVATVNDILKIIENKKK